MIKCISNYEENGKTYFKEGNIYKVERADSFGIWVKSSSKIVFFDDTDELGEYFEL